MCGLSIYQYHHIVPYSGGPHFRVADMMLLCPLHHDQATKNAFTVAEQRRWQASPFNLTRGHAAGVIKVNQPFCALRAGGVLLVGEGPLIVVEDQALVGLHVGEDGEMQLSVTLLDESDHTLVVIDRNEWITGDPLPWDIESDHQKLTLRLASGDIRLRIDARGLPLVLNAQLWRRGHRIQLNGSGVSFDGRQLRFSIQDLGLVGFSLVVQPDALQMVPYSGNAYFVSEPDPHLRLLKSLEAARSLPPRE